MVILHQNAVTVCKPEARIYGQNLYGTTTKHYSDRTQWYYFPQATHNSNIMVTTYAA